MSGIKYYQLKEDEELPDEFCAIKDVNGEPSEYTFYRPETENVKLRELVCALLQCRIEDKDICSKCDCRSPLHGECMADVMADKLGIEEIK